MTRTNASKLIGELLKSSLIIKCSGPAGFELMPAGELFLLLGVVVDYHGDAVVIIQRQDVIYSAAIDFKYIHLASESVIQDTTEFQKE